MRTGCVRLWMPRDGSRSPSASGLPNFFPHCEVFRMPAGGPAGCSPALPQFPGLRGTRAGLPVPQSPTTSSDTPYSFLEAPTEAATAAAKPCGHAAASAAGQAIFFESHILGVRGEAQYWGFLLPGEKLGWGFGVPSRGCPPPLGCGEGTLPCGC